MLSPDEILERSQWQTFWVPSDVVVVDRPELLYLSCPRDRTYLNMVTRTRAVASRYPQLIEEVRRAHRGRRSRWFVPPSVERAPLEGALDDAGYVLEGAYRVSVLEPTRYRPRPTPADLVVRPVLDKEALDQSVAVIDAAFGDLGARSLEDDARDLRLCSEDDARVLRFVGYDRRGQPLAVGNMTLFPNLSFGLLWSGATVPHARGRGAYSALLAARIAAARQRGLALVGLLANERTSSPIVARQGFSQHGVGHYWLRSPAAT